MTIDVEAPEAVSNEPVAESSITSTFVRKPLYIEAVRVTAENIEDVAKWCSGEVKKDNRLTEYVKVRVIRPLNERQTMAYVGDWVLYAGVGYKVYTDKAFQQSFDPAGEKA